MLASFLHAMQQAEELGNSGYTAYAPARHIRIEIESIAGLGLPID